VTLLEAFDAPTATPAPPAPLPTGTVPAAPAPAGPPPVVSANRRRLDNRFPVLAFSVRTQGRPWFELLLTTDRTLFDPANAAKRTPANFYAGRQDGGLSRATAEETAYVVPAAVLRRFARAVPRPAEIFYTVAAYERPDGPPILAQPVAILATTAPSVALSRDFEAQAMAVVLGVPAEKLQPVDAVGTPPGPAPPGEGVEPDPVTGVAQSWSSEDDEAAALEQASAAWFEDPHALALDDATDRGAGEPAYEGLEETGHNGHGPPHGLAAPYAEDAYGDDTAYGYEEAPATNGDVAEQGYAYGDEPADDDVVEQGYAYEEEPADGDVAEQGYAYGEDEPVDGEVGEPQGYDEAAAFDYDDGYDTAAGDDARWSAAASSAWPADAVEPEQLSDADDQRLDDELAMESGGVERTDDAEAYADEPWDDEPAVATALETPLDIPGKIAIVTKLGSLFETRDGYAGINADTEFANPRLPQYQRWHVGLSYGLIQFTQDSGGLGQLLQMMRQRDPARFREIFGPDADALVEVTTRRGPSGRQVPGGRSVRVQPVGGADLWTEPWVSRFRAAGAHPPFQAAQNELAVRRFVDPLLPFAGGFGLNTERALAMVVDRGIQMGVGGARRWLTEAIGPVRTDAQRQQALGALGFPDVAAFQRASGVRRDGDFGPVTHAALVAALRRLGPASPVPIPTREQMLDAIVARADAAAVFWRARPRTIRTSPQFADAPLSWPAPTPGP
jgi:hypothetical protein